MTARGLVACNVFRFIDSVHWLGFWVTRTLRLPLAESNRPRAGLNDDLACINAVVRMLTASMKRAAARPVRNGKNPIFMRNLEVRRRLEKNRIGQKIYCLFGLKNLNRFIGLDDFFVVRCVPEFALASHS
jgi:hypothetical protein